MLACRSTYLFLFSCLSIFCSGQNSFSLDENISIKSIDFLDYDGQIKFIFQDKQEFLWGVSNQYELVRYDGTNLKFFRNDESDSTSVVDKDFWWVDVEFIQDKLGEIWIKGPQGVGILERYDPVADRFDHIYERLRSIIKSKEEIWYRGITDIFEDSNSNIWIVSPRYLFQYNIYEDELIYYPTPKPGLSWLGFEDQRGKIWISNKVGSDTNIFYELNPESKQFQERLTNKVKNFLPVAHTRKDFAVPIGDSRKFIISLSGNLFIFDTQDYQLRHFPIENFNNEFIGPVRKSGEVILIGTKDHSLFYFDQQLEKVSEIKIDGFLDLGAVVNTNNKIFIWGLSDNNTTQLIMYNANSKAVGIPRVKGTNQANITMFTFNGEAYFDLESGLVPVRNKNAVLPRIDRNIPEVLHQNEITRHFINGTDSSLWMIACWVVKRLNHSKTLWRLFIRQFDKNGNTIKEDNFIKDGSFKRTDLYKSGDGVVLINRAGLTVTGHLDASDNLWIAGAGPAIKYNHRSGSITTAKDSLDIGNASLLFVDRENRVWFSNYDSLFIYDQGDRSMINLSITEFKDFTWFPIRYPYEDHSGNVWLGGIFDGLIRVDKNLKTYKFFGEKEGLLKGEVVKIFEDHQQNLWVSVFSNLFNFRPEENRFIELGINDGLEEIFYNWTDPHVYSDQDGFFYLPNGQFLVHYFYPDSIIIDSIVKDVVLTSFYLQDQRIEARDSTGILSKMIQYSNEICLDYSQNDFTIRYTVPEYLNTKKFEFSTKMVGYQDKWQNRGKGRAANFTNLDPGKYTFMVKAKNQHGFWSDPRSLTVTILPPWYRTWWAYSLWTLMVAGLLYSIYRFQLSRRLAQAEAQRQKELHQTKSRLFTNITHEFRTPLTVILGMVDQVKSDPGNWFNEGMGLIRRNGKQLLNLVNQMLDLSKLESGNMQLNPIHGDLIAFVRYLLESFHSYADSKDIRLHFLSDFKELTMDYDPEKMQNVFSNLLSNAIKYTPSGGDVYVEIRRSGNGGNKLGMTIKDNGIGIEAKHLPFIFDRFYQVDATTTRRGEGTGIGLALTKELVVLMGGAIQVESELAKGTTFSIVLPITHDAESITGKVRPAQSITVPEIIQVSETRSDLEAVPKSDRAIILLIEDNPDVLTYLDSFLSNEYRVEIAMDGESGIEKAIDLVPDLVVSDVMMPKKDGYEVCAFLKQDERTSHIPIILLTAKADQAAKIAGLSHGADAYLAKPFHKEELLIRIEQLIQLRKELIAKYQNKDLIAMLAAQKQYSQEDLFLRRIIAIVEENMANEHFGLPDLCMKAHLSRSQLFRKLKAVTGKSTSHFIRAIRLSKARDLLLHSDRSISEIAYAVGFSNPAYFTRTFKKEYGVAPSELRR